MQAPTTIQTLDTHVPMDINQNRLRPEMFICYNCSNKGHLSHTCPKPQKQRIQSTASAEMDIKSIIARQSQWRWMQGMWSKRLNKTRSQGRLKRIFRIVNGKTHTPFNQ